MNVKLSPYSKVYPISDNQSALYSFLHNRHVDLAIPPDAVEKYIQNPRVSDRLLNLGFLFREGEDPHSQYLRFRQNSINRNHLLDVVLHLNYDCNLACPYCYQNKIRGQSKLSRDQLHQFCQFLKSSMVGGRYNCLSLTLIGGEPTMHPELLQHLNDELVRAGVRVDCGQVVSNGFSLDEQTVDIVSNLGIQDWMITLDGMRERNDQLRFNPVSGKSFDEITSGIKLLSGRSDTHVTINMNLNRSNSNDVEPLCSWLRSWGFNGNLIFSQVFETGGTRFTDTLNKRDEVWKNAVLVAESFGFVNPAFSRTSFMGCPMFSPNTLIIGADLKVYACINAVGIEEYCVGSLDSLQQSDRNRWLNRPHLQKCCEKCLFLPVCEGNCAYLNDLHGFDCPKISFTRNEEAILAQHISKGIE